MKLGQELDSKQHWAAIAEGYVEELQNPYHEHRLSVILDLIPRSLFAPTQAIFDFGCGDAILFPHFLSVGAQISGIDIAPEIVELAHARLAASGYDPNLAQVGTVKQLRAIATASLDAMFSFNVLAYLADDEEQIFYEEARRIVKPGGFLVVTHSNELFDLFSQNRYTVEFLKELTDPTYHSVLTTLLTNGDRPENPTLYNIRENPLSYQYKLKRYGFKEVKQSFINWHPAPPVLLNGDRSYADTRSLLEQERWKLFFTCSTFGSCAVRVNDEKTS